MTFKKWALTREETYGLVDTFFPSRTPEEVLASVAKKESESEANYRARVEYYETSAPSLSEIRANGAKTSREAANAKT